MSKGKLFVISGPSGCGKSTLGRRLARSLRMPLFDTDAMIAEAEGRSIPDIFAERGEAYFRDLESAACLAVSELEGAVIATGGGAVLRKENVNALKQNGTFKMYDGYLEGNPSLIMTIQSGNEEITKSIDNEEEYKLKLEKD